MGEMVRTEKVLAVIPARGGSKGIPDKNIHPLHGKPLIAYSIESAKRSKLISKLIVSTDSPRIAEVARSLGGEVPFLRPAELSMDDSLSSDVVKHALTQMKLLFDIEFEYVLLLQPTTPLRTAEDIDSALKRLFDSGADSIVSLVDVGAHHPARMYFLKENRLKTVLEEGTMMKPRQALDPVYIRSGDIYACKTEWLLKTGTMMSLNSLPYLIPANRTINIDSPRDLLLAESLLESNKSS